jgi:hypothetical protein
VRDLQEISGISSSGRSSLGGGGRRRCSAGIHEGEGATGGWRRWSGCGEQWGSLGAREKELERSGDGRTSGAARVGNERLGGSATEGKEEGKGGGPGRGGGGATRRGGAMGPGPDRRTAPGSGPSAALVGNVRHARVLAGQSGGERRLMGGPRHSVGRWCR